MSEDLLGGILGSMVGGAVGDAFGGLVESFDVGALREITGKLWVDEFLAYHEGYGTHPLGVSQAGPPRGPVAGRAGG